MVGLTVPADDCGYLRRAASGDGLGFCGRFDRIDLIDRWGACRKFAL